MADAKVNDLTEKEQIEKDNTRFQELNKKPEAERTVDEVKELGELKERHSSRAEKRIAELNWKAKSAEERANELEDKLNKTLAEVEELKKLKEEQIQAKTIREELVEIGGKKYYTDEALMVMIQNKELTEAEAYKYQRTRDKEEIKHELRKEQEETRKKESEESIRIADAQKVRSEYPQFEKGHKDFNPDDPLYKTAMEIWTEGYHSNPRGLSLSIEKAKKILRIQDAQPDRSEDLNLEGSSAPNRSSVKTQEITLTDTEKDIAERQWTRGDVVNPKTGKAYTVAEAHAKALEAKKRRANK